ncbi:MAG: hypothetical protein N0C84_00545 [Candidatus Thiodiazotropha taylori]|nr:hypothetical protein [Candidatus Thiodiazotropha taylori]
MMWTNEFEFDITTITVIDDDATHEDVIIDLSDEHVDIKQYNEHTGKYDLVTMTPKMMMELLEAFQHPEGMFQMDIIRDM